MAKKFGRKNKGGNGRDPDRLFRIIKEEAGKPPRNRVAREMIMSRMCYPRITPNKTKEASKNFCRGPSLKDW